MIIHTEVVLDGSILEIMAHNNKTLQFCSDLVIFSNSTIQGLMQFIELIDEYEFIFIAFISACVRRS